MRTYISDNIKKFNEISKSDGFWAACKYSAKQHAGWIVAGVTVTIFIVIAAKLGWIASAINIFRRRKGAYGKYR